MAEFIGSNLERVSGENAVKINLIGNIVTIRMADTISVEDVHINRVRAYLGVKANANTHGSAVPEVLKPTKAYLVYGENGR